jgi:hypothetical protein
LTQIIIVSGTTWMVPADWNSTDNSIETIGGGGGGGTSSGGNDAGGGGGGAYSKIYNLALTPGATITIQVGAGGSANGEGGDTWFNGASLAACSVGAKGGADASGITGGAGGDQASGIGTTRFSGGNGGSSSNSQNGGAGGGGAAGPNGAGRAGGPSAGNVGSGGGGAGGGRSTAGSDGTGGAGGNGGTAQDSTAGGAGGVFAVDNAQRGSHGSGGGGGASGGTATSRGGSGGAGVDFDSNHGAGGGGGGAGYDPGTTDSIGGAGGLYGGGGGGSAYLGPSGGSGAQGVIVVNYTPAAALVTADASVPVETAESLFAQGFGAIQFFASAKSDSPLTAATDNGIRQDLTNPIEFIGFSSGNLVGVVGFSGAVARANGSLSPFESVTAVQRQTDSALALEHLSAMISASARFPLETAGPVDLPRLMPVSPGRLLRSPGRIRTLAGPGSRRPLRS